MRSVPLFYYFEGDQLKVVDKYDTFTKNPDLDPDSVKEFTGLCYTTGNNTLLPHLQQIEAGQLIASDGSIVRKEYYYQHLHRYRNHFSKNEHFKNLNDVSYSVFQRMAEYCRDKTIVLPLSGGYDSRYIIAFCRYLGIDNVMCFTYGKPASFEVKASREVARQLGYDWHYVEYNKNKWRLFLDSEKGWKYMDYVFNFSSAPHFQEFIALDELQKEGVIPDDAVFIPGFSADLLAGSHLPAEYYENRPDDLMNKDLAGYIIDHNFRTELNAQARKKITERITASLHQKSPHSPDEFVSLNEDWFTRHKVARFINNSLKIYEFFGYDWMIPLWDKELMEYWYDVPNEQRVLSALYNEYLEQEVFKPLKIHDIEKADKPSPNKLRKVMKTVLPKRLIPSMRNYIRQIKGESGMIDINAYNDLSDLAIERLKGKGLKKNDYHFSTLVAMLYLQNRALWSRPE
ncbi:asparagine synthase C-terminal domain-containing protein [Natronogracilivirga saccharolytica]|uniref:asparagine synthase (glutamine-hydrolyzing) n=1 Tax=Natronogracilivirga saccharolytica TaxID=2812953 RepID=A0A8J7SD89_9BACT|nr:asparagine synthase C-terminal domain-containing protein [Natronogracilivirga saccharolytica]MBP3193931.1 hypothetical protein [Natronogracilivirga saccharolytica]